MYDEVWDLLISTVRTAYSHMGEDAFIEADVNIWALRRLDSSPGAEKQGKYIGGNFANPHRDMVYDLFRRHIYIYIYIYIHTYIYMYMYV